MVGCLERECCRVGHCGDLWYYSSAFDIFKGHFCVLSRQKNSDFVLDFVHLHRNFATLKFCDASFAYKFRIVRAEYQSVARE